MVPFRIHRKFFICRTQKISNTVPKNTPIAHNGAVNGILFCDDGKHLISFGCHDGRTRKWDIFSGINKKVKFPKLFDYRDSCAQRHGPSYPSKKIYK